MIILKFSLFSWFTKQEFCMFIMQAEHNDKMLNTPVFYYTSAVFTVHTIQKECI